MAKKRKLSKKKSSRLKKAVARMTCMSDRFMSIMMMDQSITKMILETVLQENIKPSYIVVQKEIPNAIGKKCRPDVVVYTSDEKIYVVEVENDNTTSTTERMRYETAMIDVSNLLQGQEYSELMHVTGLYLSEGRAPVPDGFPGFVDTHHGRVRTYCFPDGRRYVFADVSVMDGKDRFAVLTRDLHCVYANEIINSKMKKRFMKVKGDDQEMCDIWDELMAEERQEMEERLQREKERSEKALKAQKTQSDRALQSVRKEKERAERAVIAEQKKAKKQFVDQAKEIAVKMMGNGMSAEMIQQYTGLSKQSLKLLAKKNQLQLV